jgi:hypothetical protein
MLARDAVGALWEDLSDSFPWKTEDSFQALADKLALQLPESEWPLVISSWDKLPNALELGDADEFEEQLNRWNGNIHVLLIAFARAAPEEALVTMGKLIDEANSKLILKNVALGLQYGRALNLTNAERFYEDASKVVDREDCALQRLMLTILMRGNDPGKRLFREKVNELPACCQELRLDMSRYCA